MSRSIIQSSLTATLLLRLFVFLSATWDASALRRLVGLLSNGWSRLWNNSVIVNVLFQRDGTFPNAWSDSRTCRLLTALLDLPASLLHRLYQAWQTAFDHSLFARLAFAMGEHVPYAIAWLMLFVCNVPYGQWNNLYSLLGFFLIFCLALAGGMRDRSLRLDATHIGPYAVLFFLAVFLSFPLSLYPNLSFRFLPYHITCALCLLLTVCTVKRTEQLERLAGLSSLALLTTSLYGISQRFLGLEINRSFVDTSLNPNMPSRIYSFFGNPNSFAQVLVLLIPIAVGLFLGTKRVALRVLSFGSALFGMVALIMTYSRASWIGLAAAALIFLFFWNRRLIPVALLGAAACIPFLPASILDRLLSIFNTSDSSTSSRFPLYQAALQMISERPVVGVGLGTTAVKAAIVERNFYDEFIHYVHTHNFYLQLWLETGLLGVLSFLAALFSGIKQGVQAFHSPTAPRSVRFLTLGALSGLVGVLLCGMADYLWTFPRVMLIFWFAVALLFTGIKLAKQSAEA